MCRGGCLSSLSAALSDRVNVSEVLSASPPTYLHTFFRLTLALLTGRSRLLRLLQWLFLSLLHPHKLPVADFYPACSVCASEAHLDILMRLQSWGAQGNTHSLTSTEAEATFRLCLRVDKFARSSFRQHAKKVNSSSSSVHYDLLFFCLTHFYFFRFLSSSLSPSSAPSSTWPLSKWSAESIWSMDSGRCVFKWVAGAVINCCQRKRKVT